MKKGQKIEKDLIEENQNLRMKIEYLKNACCSFSGRAKERQKAVIVSNLRQKYLRKELLQLSVLQELPSITA